MSHIRSKIKSLFSQIKSEHEGDFTLLAVCALAVVILVVLSVRSKTKESGYEQKNTGLSQEEILFSLSETPFPKQKETSSIRIMSTDERLSNVAYLPLTSSQEPAIKVSSVNNDNVIHLSIYEADIDYLLETLRYKEEKGRIVKKADETRMKLVADLSKETQNANNVVTRFTLPIKETGIWYVRATSGKATNGTFIVRSNVGVISKVGKNATTFWAQDIATGRSTSSGDVSVYNLKENVNRLYQSAFNSEGFAQVPNTANTDLAVITRGNDRSIVPLALRWFTVSPLMGTTDANAATYFLFTDRPLYKPGDTVNFKAIIRNDTDAVYSIPSGKAQIEIYSFSEQKNIFSQQYEISPNGSIDGSYQLPGDVATGEYSVAVSLPDRANPWLYDYSNKTSFQVDYYRKPEYTISVDLDKNEYVGGDKMKFKVHADYFSGQPLANQKIKYSIYQENYLGHSYLISEITHKQTGVASPIYGYGRGGARIKEGILSLDRNGEVASSIDLPLTKEGGGDAVISVQATLADGSQSPAYDSDTALLYAGIYGIYRKSGSYSARVGQQTTVPILLAYHFSESVVPQTKLIALIEREEWIPTVVDGKGKIEYKLDTEQYPSQAINTNTDGSGELLFTPTKKGTYKFKIKGRDDRNNLVEQTVYLYVSDRQGSYFSSKPQHLFARTDISEYRPGETAKVYIYSDTPDRDVLLSVERGYARKMDILHMSGNTAEYDMSVTYDDIPNLFVQVNSFVGNALETAMVPVTVSAESKRIQLDVKPRAAKYKPGDTVQLDIHTAQFSGKSKKAEVTLWAVDKSLFELKKVDWPDIFQKFWHERSNSTRSGNSLQTIYDGGGMGGGCFVEGTKVLMSNGKKKNIEQLRAGEYVLTRKNEVSTELVRARVKKVYTAFEPGYLLINNRLKVTADHILWVNNDWKEAGSVLVGDTLLDSRNQRVVVTSIEWKAEKVSVHNLEVDTYHTYFADGLWVHNDKGAPRFDFKDVAYWNPAIQTDDTGNATVRFVLPDNLTTWVLVGYAHNVDTEVGQSTNEITVSKDLVVRPIIPNLLRVGDEAQLRSLVQNFTNQTLTLDLGFSMDSSDIVKKPNSPLKIDAQSQSQPVWEVKPKQASENAKIKFAAKAVGGSDDSDEVITSVPVVSFGYHDKRTEFKSGSAQYQIKLNSKSDNDKTKIRLSLTPTILGSLSTAMNYLLSYPYGCVEQTTSRLVPAIVAESNRSQFASVLKNKDVDGIIQTSIDTLTTYQQFDGGWGWYSNERTDAYVTAYVVEYLQAAKELGKKYDSSILERAKDYLHKTTYYDVLLQKDQPDTVEDVVAKRYGLAVLGESKKENIIHNYKSFAPDLLAMTVMVNYVNGEKNPDKNGLTALQKKANVQGNTAYWTASSKSRFGSRDASTALALRAILYAKGDVRLAKMAGNYLMKSRKYEYWSNTYATSQAVRALAELLKLQPSSPPSYSYTVELDGSELLKGSVNSDSSSIEDVVVPAEKIRKNGSKLGVVVSDGAQMYSMLSIDEYMVDDHAPRIDNDMKLTRIYENTKGNEYEIGVGDIVNVKLVIEGLKNEEEFAVVKDELPAGMVPINESFASEQYQASDEWKQFVHAEYGQNDLTIVARKLKAGTTTFSYRARAISAGEYRTPPAYAELMYSPAVNSRSDTQIITINSEPSVKKNIIQRTFFNKSKVGVQKDSTKTSKGTILFIIVTVFTVFTSMIYLLRNSKNINNSKKNSK